MSVECKNHEWKIIQPITHLWIASFSIYLGQRLEASCGRLTHAAKRRNNLINFFGERRKEKPKQSRAQTCNANLDNGNNRGGFFHLPHTISNQCDSAMSPGFKHLVLEIDLGDQVFGGSIDKVTNGTSIGNFMVNNL